MWTGLLGVLAFPLLFYIYIRLNDRSITRLPPEALTFSPTRYTRDDARSTRQRLVDQPISVMEQMPTSTGRRYIIVGGAGFLGGWIVLHLLQRGEDARKIRILDIRPPSRPDLSVGDAQDVDFLQVDISDVDAVEAAFKKPWPASSDGIKSAEPEITVFHTAANIRFYERHPALLARSAKVNINGTRNIINAARSVGTTVLIQTSSGSVSVRSNRLWLWPWESEPKYFVQVLNDDDNLIPGRHEEFFSNYAATKVVGERIVREANGTSSGSGILRTGCIRPSNGIFGPGGDILCGAYLVRKKNPSWIHNMVQNFTYVENGSLAHLLYEQRLIELSNGSDNPDISGQAFTISDPCAPPTYGDVYTVLETLDDDASFPKLSPTAMLFIAQILEFLYLARYFLGSSRFRILRLMSHVIPEIKGDIVNLQPSLFNLTQVHLIFDDSRARLSPNKGGLGYEGGFTTLEGLCKTAAEHKKAGGKGEERSLSGGVSFGWGQIRAERAVENVGEKLGIISVAN